MILTLEDIATSTPERQRATRGPWDLNADLTFVGRRAENGSLDLIASVRGSIPQGEERNANARLIAAAPELLAMCQGLLTVAAKMDDDLTVLGKGRNLSSVPGHEGADILQSARALLARA